MQKRYRSIESKLWDDLLRAPPEDAHADEAEAASPEEQQQQERAAKVQQFREHIQKRLLPDRARALEVLTAVRGKLKETRLLLKNVGIIQEQKLSEMRTMVDVGSKVFAEAHMYVCVELCSDSASRRSLSAAAAEATVACCFCAWVWLRHGSS